MIGKSLSERVHLETLAPSVAIQTLTETLESHAKPIVEVRSQDARMIACFIVRADRVAIRICRSLGFEMKRGATAVFGLLGDDAARLFPHLAEHHRAWLATPCTSRETKILLVAGGMALLSLETNAGNVVIHAH